MGENVSKTVAIITVCLYLSNGAREAYTFSQSILMIETSGWDQKIVKVNVHILVTISAQIDALSVT